VSVAAGESTAFIGAADPYTGSIDKTTGLMLRQAKRLDDERSTMTEIADETGGHGLRWHQ
jgi:hypothetical protein